MTKNNQGVALVAGLLIAILISAVGFAGYYVYNENKSNKLADENVKQGQDEVAGYLEETEPVTTPAVVPAGYEQLTTDSYAVLIPTDEHKEQLQITYNIEEYKSDNIILGDFGGGCIAIDTINNNAREGSAGGYAADVEHLGQFVDGNQLTCYTSPDAAIINPELSDGGVPLFSKGAGDAGFTRNTIFATQSGGGVAITVSYRSTDDDYNSLPLFTDAHIDKINIVINTSANSLSFK